MLACARCGAFACATCAKIPTLLCAACQTRKPAVHEPWDAIPPAPGLALRALTSIPVLYGAFAVLLVASRSLDSALPLMIVIGASLAVIAVGMVRIVSSMRGRRGRLLLRDGLRAMREQRNREAAVAFEEAARFARLDPPGRVLALWLFATCASSLGEYERALALLEPLTPSGWRHYRAMRLLRGPGQIVLAVTRALAGDLEGAAAARAAYAPTLLHRFTYAPSYGDALLALRRGEASDAVRGFLDQSYRQSRRVADEPLRRATSLLDGFYRELRGEGEADVEAALVPARLSPSEAHQGLARRWPALSDFVRRRLIAPGG